MGGDNFKDAEESSSYPDFSQSSSSPCSCCFSDDLGVSEENIKNHATDLRKREKTYQEILENHDLLQEKLRNSGRKLKLARRQILSYTPGSFADVNLSDYGIPKTTSILIVGPEGAGKSSLVNRITRVIEDDEFAPARAQESYGTQCKGGTLFVQEYMIPRTASASSFCLYDTRGLSQSSSSDYDCKIEQWITKGVHHGESVIWTSDSSDLRDKLIRDGCTGCEIRKVNSVIFVVNAVEILKSMESDSSYAHMISTAFKCPLLAFQDDKPAVVMTHGDILSREERARVRVFLGELLGIPPGKQIFDIPESQDAATALTICNLLRHSLEHADKNLRFLRKRNFTVPKVERDVKKKDVVRIMLAQALLMLALLLTFVLLHNRQNVAHEARHKLHTFPGPRSYNLTHEAQPKRTSFPRPVIGGPINARVRNSVSESVPKGEPSIDWRETHRLLFDKWEEFNAKAMAENVAHEARPSFDWRKTRHLWFDEGKVVKGKAEGEPSFDWRKTRHLWFDEGKVVKAKAEGEPSFDWRTTRRLWYVE